MICPFPSSRAASRAQPSAVPSDLIVGNHHLYGDRSTVLHPSRALEENRVVSATQCPLYPQKRTSHRSTDPGVHRQSSDTPVVARSLSISASKDWMRVRSLAKTVATST